MRGRYDVQRSLLASFAAGLAVLGAAAASLDHGFAGWEISGQVLSVDAIAAAGLALIPGGHRWSGRRRAAAFWFAAASFFVGATMELFVGARAACGCGDPAGGYMLPTILGVPAQVWVALGLVVVPLLIGLAGVGDRRSIVREHHTPVG
jgi:hypothetical protein